MDQYKLVVIDKEGRVDKRGDRNVEDLLHVVCLLGFIKEQYPNNETLKKLNFRHSVNTVGFFLTLYGNAILFNTTKHEEKYGKSALLMVPECLSDSQKQSIEELLADMNEYSLTIGYDLKVIDGILEGKEISALETQQPLNVLEIYYKKQAQAERKLV